MEKLCFIKFQILIVSSTFFFKYFFIQRSKTVQIKNSIFRRNSRSGLLSWFSLHTWNNWLNFRGEKHTRSNRPSTTYHSITASNQSGHFICTFAIFGPCGRKCRGQDRWIRWERHDSSRVTVHLKCGMPKLNELGMSLVN